MYFIYWILARSIKKNQLKACGTELQCKTVYKMRKKVRKFVKIAFLLGIALACWIYWKTNAAFNEARNIQPLPLSSPSKSSTVEAGGQVAREKMKAARAAAARAAMKRENIIKMYHTINDVSLQPLVTCRPFFVILVTSNVEHVKRRNTIRRLMPSEELREIDVIRVFLLAQIPDKENSPKNTNKHVTQSAINDESKTYGDILQGKFVENYRNQTYKHLMGLKWASTACQDASFIIKKNDDTVFNFKGAYTSLQSGHYSTSLLMGFIIKNTRPIRDPYNKWYVTWNEYSRQEYPPYLSGWFYITTPKVATALCDEASYHPYFWIDDIFVTGLLTESRSIELTQISDKFWK